MGSLFIRSYHLGCSRFLCSYNMQVFLFVVPDKLLL